MMQRIRMIKSRTPSMLFAEVMEELRNGKDIHTPMFVSYSGELVLWGRCEFAEGSVSA